MSRLDMERHLKDATPKYALVVWPDDQNFEQPSCIELAGVPAARAVGAVVVAVEDAEFCHVRPRPYLDMTLLSNPIRRKPKPKDDDAD